MRIVICCSLTAGVHDAAAAAAFVFFFSQGGKGKGGKKTPLGSSRGGGGNTGGGQTVEQRYQKKTQLEHILLRPDTYSESIEHTQTLVQLVLPLRVLTNGPMPWAVLCS